MKYLEKGDKKLVEKFVKINKGVFGIEHDYHEVQANRFNHLDSKFYSNTQEMAEKKGFQLIGDVEDVTLKNQTPNPRTFIRTLSNHQNIIKPSEQYYLCFLSCKTAFSMELDVFNKIITTNKNNRI